MYTKINPILNTSINFPSINLNLAKSAQSSSMKKILRNRLGNRNSFNNNLYSSVYTSKPDNIDNFEKLDSIDKKEKPTYLNTSGNLFPRLKHPKIDMIKLYNRLRGEENDHWMQKLNQLTSRGVTDDTLFALSEIYVTDKKIFRREQNRKHIWDIHKFDSNIYGTNANKNYHDIHDVREKVKIRKSEGFDLRNEVEKNKYFPRDRIEVVEEGEGIINRLLESKKGNTGGSCGKNKCNNNNQDKLDIHTFAKQNREICIKNFIIDLLKSEKQSLADKEQKYIKDLTDAKNGFEKDYQLFNDLVTKQKSNYKISEFKLNSLIRENKILLEKKRQLNQEYKNIKDDIEKTIRSILLYKNYADFIHLVIGKQNRISKVSLGQIDMINFSQESEKIYNKIITEFDFLLSNQDNDEFSHINMLKNPSVLVDLFSNLEMNILKNLKHQDEIKYKCNIEKLSETKEIDDLKNKINEYNREYENLLEEYRFRKNISGQTKNDKNESIKNKQTTYNSAKEQENEESNQIKIYEKYIQELFEVVCEKSITSHPLYNEYLDLIKKNAMISTIKYNSKRRSFIGIGGFNMNFNDNASSTQNKTENNCEIFNLRMKMINDSIKEIFKSIANKEHLVNFYINEMEITQNDGMINSVDKENDLFKKILETVKKENKMKKYQEGRDNMKKIEEEKKVKYQMRQNRYKINRYEDYPPPNILSSKIKVNSVEKQYKENDYEQMITY